MKYDHLIGLGFNRWSEGEYTPGQTQAFLDFNNSFILMSGSFRSGKTELGARAVIRHAYFFPYSKCGVFRQHLASLKKSTLLTVLELIHKSWVADWSNSDLILTLKNGSTIVFMGADFADRLGSIELTYAFIDEATEVHEQSLDMIQGRLSGQLKLPSNVDSLPDDSQAYLNSTLDKRQTILACNPKSTSHYVYKRFIDKPKPGHICYTSNSISNPNLPEVYLVNNLSAYVRPGHDRKWVVDQVLKVRKGEAPSDGMHMLTALTPFGQRNLLGQWVAMEGAIYEMDEPHHVIESLQSLPDGWSAAKSHIICGDFGFHNPRLAVLSVHNVRTATGTQDGYIFIHGWHEKNSVPDSLVTEVVNLKERFNLRNCYLPNDQPGIKRTVRKSTSNSFVKTVKMAVAPGINVVSRFINQHLFLFLRSAPDFDLAWAEMSGYQWMEEKSTGESGTFKDQPVKENDHYPDAFRYGIYSRHYKEGLNVSESDEDYVDVSGLLGSYYG